MMGFFVTGTDTGVGKTVVATGLARLMTERGFRVGVMKPIETGCNIISDDKLPHDGSLLAEAARIAGENQWVVPCRYAEPLAPLVAARREKKPVDFSAIWRAWEYLQKNYELAIVEGAGGLSVPISEGFTMADLAQEMKLPLLIVARPVLGTLNHTFLTVHYARSKNLKLMGIIISGYDKATEDIAEQTNPEMLEELCELPVLGCVPKFPEINKPEDAARAVGEGIDLERFIQKLILLAKQ